MIHFTGLIVLGAFVLLLNYLEFLKGDKNGFSEKLH